MKLEIHDVDHGGCVLATSPTGHRLMLDCGLSFGRPWFPSITYRGEYIDTLMLLNLDEDHVEDLQALWNDCPIGAIVSNPTVTAAALSAMKSKGMRSGVRTAHNILSAFGTGLIGNYTHSLGGIHWHAFWNAYGTEFTDTNNLSLAVFVTFGGVTILFGGDLETAGWRKLLLNPDFRRRLSEVKVFVASHHGRDNGCCDELFLWCRPELIIFSDGEKQHETQETAAWYRGKATGIPDWTRSPGIFGIQPKRHVMTTRKDGTIQIDVTAAGEWSVTRKPRPYLGALSTLPALPYLEHRLVGGRGS